MSFHHGHHHHSPPHHHLHTSYTSSCCCCCCKSSDYTIPIPSSLTSNSDQLLQALLLIQSTQSQSPIFLQPQPPPRNPNINNNPHNRHHHHHQSKHEDNHNDPSPLLLHSLIRRVAALESFLSSSSPPQKQQQQQPSSSPAKQKQSLKHLAASTIQRCFRRFLARRSKTLRDLKHLASIKSHAASLRSSLSSHKSIRNPRALSCKAMDLLFQLDSIQSSDPMIREGKRSVSKELVRISEFVDKILIPEKEEEDEVVRVRDSGRRVSFNGGDECKVFDDLSEILSEEEETETLLRGHPEGPCDRSSYGEESPRVVNGHFQGSSNGGLGLAAPLPVKMEPRRNGSMKKMANEEKEED